MSRMPWKFDQEGIRRNILPAEYAPVNGMLSVHFSGSAELKLQLDSPNLCVTSYGEILIFDFVIRPTAYAATKYQVPVEAKSKDLDGMEISVSLHVVDGRLYELEVYRLDGEGISQPPAPESLNDFFVVGEPS